MQASEQVCVFIYVMRPLSFALARPVEDASGSSEAELETGSSRLDP